MDQDRRAEFVETWARLFEGQGETRIAGRIYAHLATSGEADLSLQQLAEQLGVSKASISTNTRRLIEQGMLARVEQPGSREQRYAVDATATREMVARIALATRAVADLAEQGLQLQPGVVTPGTQGLRAMVEIMTEMALTLERLAAGNGRRSRAAKRVAQ